MLPHDSAHLHVRGQSEFIDDRPSLQGEVFLSLVYSPHAHAKILKIDATYVLSDPLVVGFYTHKDLHHNRWGTIFQDQPVLAETEVNYVGEVVAVIAATTRQGAVLAQRKVKVEYEVLPAILSVDGARKRDSFIGEKRKIERGDLHSALLNSKHRLKGKIVIRGAEHFYLENQCAIAYPKEEGQVEVHSSAQHPTEVQHVVSHALGLDSKDVVCVVKRMGGAFGGKESQAAPIAAYAALVASKLGRPARIVLNKDEDMIHTGKRNPFENEYEVGFDDQGKIHALDIQLFSDGGAYADLSTAIMERAMLHCDNAYYIHNVRITGQVCRTHFHPHTAFRGFGGPKGVATIEKIIEEIAFTLKKDALDIRKLNCYQSDGKQDKTPYGQVVENNCLPALFEELEITSDYRKRRAEIEAHNRSSEHTYRGLSMTAVKFGISFTTRFLNQANALVVIHRDGTFQVSTGATEMGQGVNARIAQVVAEEFGLERSKVRVMPTSTDKNANTSPTAASSGTDLNASAAVIAGRKIKHRLSELALRLLEIPEDKWARKTAAIGSQREIELQSPPYNAVHPNEGADFAEGTQTFQGIEFKGGLVYTKKNPDKKIFFQELVNEAYLNRISLSDYGFYRFPGLSFNKLTGEGKAFLYFTQGVAASEVSIHRLTGETKVRRVDILMDLGRPINEALDLGQVYGGFIQGMGWVTTEKLFYSKEGALLSHSPSTYKIPSIQDTPRTFNVQLLPNDKNLPNIRGTKAVGEPPLLLSLSVWTAIADAIKNIHGYPVLEIPATQEEILRAIFPEEFNQFDSLQ